MTNCKVVFCIMHVRKNIARYKEDTFRIEFHREVLICVCVDAPLYDFLNLILPVQYNSMGKTINFKCLGFSFSCLKRVSQRMYSKTTIIVKNRALLHSFSRNSLTEYRYGSP